MNVSDFEDIFVPDRGFCIKGGRIVFGKSAIDCNKLIKEKALEIIQRKTIVVKVSRDDLVLNKILKTVECVKKHFVSRKTVRSWVKFNVDWVRTLD